jgi:uncharacterized protein YktA (UPF0223 family)
MDELHGIFIAYEMRIERENLVTKEASFKSSKKSKKRERKRKNKIATTVKSHKTMKKYPTLSEY